MSELLDPMKNPVTYAIPFFILTILIELAALKWLDHDTAFHREGALNQKPRTGYLVAIPYEDGLGVIGTKFGQRDTPDWVLNLEADPAATVTVKLAPATNAVPPAVIVKPRPPALNAAPVVP